MSSSTSTSDPSYNVDEWREAAFLAPK
ncbi:hypothetical protein KIPB_012785, partial [Kipferlia bialata]|eukprot:g12785.t1